MDSWTACVPAFSVFWRRVDRSPGLDSACRHPVSGPFDSGIDRVSSAGLLIVGFLISKGLNFAENRLREAPERYIDHASSRTPHGHKGVLSPYSRPLEMNLKLLRQAYARLTGRFRSASRSRIEQFCDWCFRWPHPVFPY